MPLESKELKLAFRIEMIVNAYDHIDVDVFRAYLKQSAERYEKEHERISLETIQIDQINMDRKETLQME